MKVKSILSVLTVCLIAFISTSMLSDYVRAETNEHGDDFLGVRLHGTVLSGKGSDLALVSVKDGPQVYIRKNELITDTEILYEVYPRYIVIKNSSGMFRLDLSRQLGNSTYEYQDPTLEKGQGRTFHYANHDLEFTDNYLTHEYVTDALGPGQDRKFGDVPVDTEQVK